VPDGPTFAGHDITNTAVNTNARFSFFAKYPGKYCEPILFLISKWSRSGTERLNPNSCARFSEKRGIEKARGL